MQPAAEKESADDHDSTGDVAGRRWHLRGLLPGRRPGPGPGRSRRTRRASWPGGRGEDRRLRHAGLRGAPCLGQREYPIVLVISEVFGVHEYIRDSTRRFAKAGYYAIAPELFKREGGVAQLTNIQDILKIVLAQPRPQTLGDLKAAVDWAKTRPGVRADSVGVTGWCWGGSTTIQVAATNPDMKAAVAWYGPPARPYQGPSGAVTGFDVAKDIKIPFLFLLGSTDTNPRWPTGASSPKWSSRGTATWKSSSTTAPGHGFHADYRPSYNPVAAADAWKRCIDWFNQYLKG